MRPRLAAALLLSAAAFALSAAAHADAQGVALRYDAPDGCPSSAAFEGAVGRFSSRVVFEHDDDGRPRSLTVTVRERAPLFVGEVAVGTGSVRSVEGATCGEVVDALALIAALAIDPTAKLSPPAPAAPIVPPPAAPPPAPPIPPPAPPPPTPPPPPDLLVPEEEAVPTRAIPARWHADLDAAGTLRSGIASVGVLGATLGVSLRSRSDRPLAPVLGVAFAYATSGPFDGTSPAATYQLFAGQLLACPVRLARVGAFSLFPCLATDVGVIQGTGESSSVTHLTQSAPLWLDGTLGLRGVVHLAGPFFAQVDASGAVSFVQPSFIFREPQRSIASVSGFGLVGSLGAGVTFW
jgi:hypothetical protein